MCCTPMDYAERSLVRCAALADRMPQRCPDCGSTWIAPTFWPDASLDVWDCSNPECHAVFSGRGD